MPADCPCEATTQHFKGSPPGHGPVLDSETVTLAVFRDTPYDTESRRLLPAAFPTDRLNGGNLSLARLSHTNRSTFDTQVVAGRMDDLVGVACASAFAIRQITYDSTSHPAFKGRGVCLLDKVEDGDHDGHASLGWGRSDVELSVKQKQRAREAIKRNLADTFTLVVLPDGVDWAVESLTEQGV